MADTPETKVSKQWDYAIEKSTSLNTDRQFESSRRRDRLMSPLNCLLIGNAHAEPRVVDLYKMYYMYERKCLL